MLIEQSGVATLIHAAGTNESKVVDLEHAAACDVRVGDHSPNDAKAGPSAGPRESKLNGLSADAATGAEESSRCVR